MSFEIGTDVILQLATWSPSDYLLLRALLLRLGAKEVLTVGLSSVVCALSSALADPAKATCHDDVYAYGLESPLNTYSKRSLQGVPDLNPSAPRAMLLFAGWTRFTIGLSDLLLRLAETPAVFCCARSTEFGG